ncbi:hypothetical protein [Maribellus comscasis]|nr:hypothetical protein [Maribellus comscasis]
MSVTVHVMVMDPPAQKSMYELSQSLDRVGLHPPPSATAAA